MVLSIITSLFIDDTLKVATFCVVISIIQELLHKLKTQLEVMRRFCSVCFSTLLLPHVSLCHEFCFPPIGGVYSSVIAALTLLRFYFKIISHMDATLSRCVFG